MSIIKLVAVFIPVFFVSCASTKIRELEIARAPATINREISQKQLASKSYVFIRLYDVAYDKPLRPGNFLRKPIRMFGCAPNGTAYVHSAISTVLNDESFLGLALQKKNNMACYESVEDLSTNEYMMTIDGKRSRCIVLALPCSQLDRENVRQMVEYCGKEDSAMIYGILKNAVAAIGHWGNKKNFERSRNFPIEFAFDSIPLETEVSKVIGKVYVCSSFIASLLQKTVERYRVDFLCNGINPMGYTPVDLYYLDEAIPLFECNFYDYDETLEEFTKLYPKFAEYIN